MHGQDDAGHDHEDERDAGERDAGIAAGHGEVAMGEIHRAGGLEDEDEAERRERVGGAERDPVGEELDRRHGRRQSLAGAS